MKLNQLTASRIKELRQKLGITAESVANDLQISKSAYSQLENGHVEITLPRIEALTQIFQVSLSEIFPTINNGSHTYTGDNGVNVSQSSNHTINNFFAENEEKMQTLIDALKDVFSGRKGK